MHNMRLGLQLPVPNVIKLTKAEVNLRSLWLQVISATNVLASKEQNSSIYKIANNLVTPKHHVATPTLFDANINVPLQ